MSKKKEVHYIIAYDISDERRLRKVHRLVKEYAINLQYSVFIAHFNQTLLEEMIIRLKEVISETRDDIRVYPLSEQHTPDIFGKRTLPDGFFLMV